MIRAWLDGLGPRDRRALALGLLVLVPGLVWIAGVRPYRAVVAGLEDRIAAERELLQRERSLLASETEVRSALRKAEKEAGSAGRRLATAPNEALAEAEVTDALEVMGVECRVLLTEIRSVAMQEAEEAPTGVSTFRLAVEGESDMAGVLAFVQEVETSALLLRVVGMTLDPVTEEAGEGSTERPTGVVEFTLVVEGYARTTAAAPSTTSEEAT